MSWPSGDLIFARRGWNSPSRRTLLEYPPAALMVSNTLTCRKEDCTSKAAKSHQMGKQCSRGKPHILQRRI